MEQRRRALLPTDGKVSGGAKKMFPNQLYHMLESVDGTPHSLLVRWLPHGRSFMVFDTTRFAVEVLQLYFPSQSKFTSFQRQLNIYGFLRCISVDDGYYHELFLRGRPALVSLIPRRSYGHHPSRRAFDPTSEPNFYAMAWLPDIAVAMNKTGSGVANGATDHAMILDGAHPSVSLRSCPPSSQMPRPVRNHSDVLVRRSTQSSSDADKYWQTNTTSLPFAMPMDTMTNGVFAAHGRPFERGKSLNVYHQLSTLFPTHTESAPSQIHNDTRTGSTMNASSIVTDRDDAVHSMVQLDPDSERMLLLYGSIPGSCIEAVDNGANATLALVDARWHAQHCNGQNKGAGCVLSNSTQEEVGQENVNDQIDRSSTSSSNDSLGEWVEFLHDVDLD